MCNPPKGSYCKESHVRSSSMVNVVLVVVVFIIIGGTNMEPRRRTIRGVNSFLPLWVLEDRTEVSRLGQQKLLSTEPSCWHNLTGFGIT